MGQFGTIIAQAANMGMLYTERLIKDVSASQFARFARPGGVEMRSNHPAFVLGHLSLYPADVMDRLQQPHGVTTVPAGYPERFKAGVECQDDPGGKLYPPMSELVAFYFAAHKAAMAALSAAPDEMLLQPNPAEGRSRELFPTIGTLLTFYLNGHVQMHLGQVSAWRRGMGLPAA